MKKKILAIISLAALINIPMSIFAVNENIQSLNDTIEALKKENSTLEAKNALLKEDIDANSGIQAIKVVRECTDLVDQKLPEVLKEVAEIRHEVHSWGERVDNFTQDDRITTFAGTMNELIPNQPYLRAAEAGLGTAGLVCLIVGLNKIGNGEGWKWERGKGSIVTGLSLEAIVAALEIYARYSTTN